MNIKFFEKFSFSEKISIVATFVFWISLIIFFALYKVNPEPKEKFIPLKIQISVNDSVKSNSSSSEKMAEILESSSKPIVEKIEKTESVEKIVPKTVKKEENSKPTIAKSTKKAVTPSAAPKLREEKLVQSMEDLVKAQQSAPKKEVVWDESIFEDSEEVSSTNNSTVVPISKKIVQEFQGAAGTLDESRDSTSVEVQGVTAKVQNASSSIDESQLKKLMTSTSESSLVSQKNAASTINNSNQSVKLDDGSLRRLIEPKKIQIVLSESSQRLIESSREVVISFMLLESGTIPISGIEINPRGLLPIVVESEIKAQIATWRFEKGNSDGHARFNYSINKE